MLEGWIGISLLVCPLFTMCDLRSKSVGNKPRSSFLLDTIDQHFNKLNNLALPFEGLRTGAWRCIVAEQELT